MGIKPLWHQEVVNSLAVFGLSLSLDATSKFDLLVFGQGNVIVNLVSLNNIHKPEALIELQESYKNKNIYLIHLWEDIWASRRLQVISRLMSILGLNKKIHGRKTKITAVTQLEADVFFNAHHILASAKCRYRLALTHNGELVAVAGFSNLRFMTKISAGYRSAELIRFASITGYTVTGGFTKLLKYFAETLNPNDVMSYADKDWSLGQAYERSGFTLVAETPPSEILLNPETMVRYFPHRLPATSLTSSDGNGADQYASPYVSVFNTGNLKYLLAL